MYEPYVNDAPSIARMNQVERLIPFVFFGIVATLLPVDVRNGRAGRYPEQGGEQNDRHCGPETRHY